MVKLTAPQIRALRYYRDLGDKVPRADRTEKSPDPRVAAALLGLGFLQVIGQNYGPLYGITDSGREALKENTIITDAIEAAQMKVLEHVATAGTGRTFGHLMVACGLETKGRVWQGGSGLSHERVLDRALQGLRKKGLIAFKDGEWRIGWATRMVAEAASGVATMAKLSGS